MQEHLQSMQQHMQMMGSMRSDPSATSPSRCAMLERERAEEAPDSEEAPDAERGP
jgi:hypothetical protein